MGTKKKKKKKFTPEHGKKEEKKKQKKKTWTLDPKTHFFFWKLERKFTQKVERKKSPPPRMWREKKNASEPDFLTPLEI